MARCPKCRNIAVTGWEAKPDPACATCAGAGVVTYKELRRIRRGLPPRPE